MSLGKDRIPLGLGFLVCEMRAWRSGYPRFGFPGVRPGGDRAPDCLTVPLAVFQVSHSLKDLTVEVPRDPP